MLPLLGDLEPAAAGAGPPAGGLGPGPPLDPGPGRRPARGGGRRRHLGARLGAGPHGRASGQRRSLLDDEDDIVEVEPDDADWASPRDSDWAASDFPLDSGVRLRRPLGRAGLPHRPLRRAAGHRDPPAAGQPRHRRPEDGPGGGGGGQGPGQHPGPHRRPARPRRRRRPAAAPAKRPAARRRRPRRRPTCRSTDYDSLTVAQIQARLVSLYAGRAAPGPRPTRSATRTGPASSPGSKEP